MVFLSCDFFLALQKKFFGIQKKKLPHTSATVSFQDSYPAMSPTPGNYELLRQLDQVSRSLGYGPVEAVDPGQRGAAAVSFLAPYLDALDGLGVVGSGGHTVEESVDLSSLPLMAKRAAIFIYQLTQE